MLLFPQILEIGVQIGRVTRGIRVTWNKKGSKSKHFLIRRSPFWRLFISNYFRFDKKFVLIKYWSVLLY